ncbi:MAG: ATP-binding cassette domain-containing protein [Verrucomicrobia bacterium]|nr:ATP-binding cassette domain-containing protein [Verrucomicrobiota bacterium]
MIEVSHLTKSFRSHKAVKDLSFTVAPGEIVGFLGPNGAGKTTTMRILATYLSATSGQVRIAGFDVFTHPLEVRRQVGYLPENVPLYEDMRVSEYLIFRGRLKELSGRRLRSRIQECLSACGLEPVARKMIGRLSKGYKQRVGLADALLHEPALLILDEPTIGLDPNQIRDIRQLIKNLGGKHTVLLSSHILSEVELICQRVIIMNKGKMVASNDTRELISNIQGRSRVLIQVQGDPVEIEATLKLQPGIVSVRCNSTEDKWCHFECECDDDGDMCPSLFRLASDHGWAVREMRTESRNLEDVFVALTRQSEKSYALGEARN